MTITLNIVELLLRERVRITAAAHVVLHDPHLADDVFQQVVLLGLQTPPEFREPEHVIAWALRTARHRAINLARDQKLIVLDETVLDQLCHELNSLDVQQVEARTSALHQCIERLPKVARQLLKLRHTDGLKCERIAKRTNRSVDAIYQNLSRLHRLLRDCVERRLAEE
jgi:RNA polymerase sigma-70 factor, ECF subfamily